MSDLRIRWASGPDDVPAEGEALMRLERVPGSRTVERIAGAGLSAPLLTYDRDTDTFRWADEAQPTDLAISRHRYRMTARAADGRELVAHFGAGVAAPQVDADAPADLLRALVRAWRALPPPGRPPEREQRIAEIVDAARELGAAATSARVAIRLGRADEDGRPQTDYKRDLRAAGGWSAVKARAGLL